jgi:hypothetical protein
MNHGNLREEEELPSVPSAAKPPLLTIQLQTVRTSLTLILLTWTIWRAPTNASKWRMGFNSAFKGLITIQQLSLLTVSLN